MPTISLDVTDEVASYWRRLAQQDGLSVEEWAGLCCVLVGTVGVPVTQAVVRTVTAQREYDSGAVCEIVQVIKE